MPLDPNIILSGQQQPNFADQYGKAIQLKALVNQGKLQDLQYQQVQQEMEGARKLRDLYSGNVNPDGTLNRAGILQGAASQGLGDKIPGLQKSWADMDKSQLDADKTRGEISHQKFTQAKEANQLVQSTIASLANDPNLNYDQVRNNIIDLENKELIDHEHAMYYIKAIPQTANQAQLKQFLYQAGLQAADAGKRLEMLTPKFEKIDAGGQIIAGTVDPMTGQFTGRGAVQKTNSPDALLNARTQRALAAQGVSIQTDANGNLVAVPNRAAPGAPVTASPVLDAGGKPVTGKDSASGKQAAAAAKINPILDEAEGLIDQATGSYLGTGRDYAARAFGSSTKGADATARLKVLEGSLMLAQPRMEGPQSDKDVALYRQMAAQIGDPTVPASQKKAAMQTLRSLYARYGAQSQTGNSTNRSATPAPTNNRGWTLHTDANGNRAYVSPDGSQYEEVQ